MKHDIVYILGSGSKWKNNELRYSLRSLEKHFDHGKVFIVGERPLWLQNVIHIDCQDSFAYGKGGKLRNAIKKIRAVCHDERLSEEFVLMNDDFFFLNDCPKIEPYSIGTLQEMIDQHPTKTGHYFNAIRGTMNFLKRRGIENPVSYAIHYPIVYEKKKFLEMTSEPRFRKIAYSWRSIYGNVFDIGNIKRSDTKISSDHLESFLNKEDKGDFLSSNNDVVLQPAFQEWIQRLFPERSKYEK